MVSIDDAKQLAYSLDRREHTAKCMVETNPQIAFKTDSMGKSISVAMELEREEPLEKPCNKV
jgi:hypothetical protein